MKFEEKIRKTSHQDLWQEYCGFLDLSLSEYMFIQHRLMEEQVQLWSACPLGKKLLGGKAPESVEDFLAALPLTTYEDYAEDLLAHRAEVLCATPSIWIETTWEGGLRPVKTAPYSREMLDTYRHNLIALMMMASAKEKGDVNLCAGDRVLYGGAPLPYATGLMPSLLEEDIHLKWLPDGNMNADLSFSQRVKKGFAMGLADRVDYFFGLGSVANYITENFSAQGGGSSSGGRRKVSLMNALRYLRGKARSRQEGTPLKPSDIFHLKAFFYAGTDAACYKDRLSRAWNAVPCEIAAGTESTCIGAETWEHQGMTFFPDACFYEFIPETEMKRGLRDPKYQPRTCLMDEVRSGGTYELVISVLHGGAFMRYRIGDVYRCVSAGNDQIPRFAFVDRVPNVIDIAGFTRITQSSMEEVIRLSGLQLGDWFLRKEFDDIGTPFLHLYLEIPPEAQRQQVTTCSVLTEQMAIYFQYFDSDYSDLKKLLNMEPLQITILKYGTISAYEQERGEAVPRVNPEALDVAGVLKKEALLARTMGREGD